MKELSIDFETRATVDLKKTGVYPYAEHPDTDIWCMAWAFGDDEPQIWIPSQSIPMEILEHIIHGGTVRAWNAQFERIIWREIMEPRYGAPAIKLEQWIDTAAEAAAMALPRYLEGAAKVCHVTQQKDNAGYRLMLRMTRPRKKKAGEPELPALVWNEEPEQLEKLYEYCKQDVRTERAMVKVVRRLTPREVEVYQMDQRINDRGVAIDIPLILASQVIVDEATQLADDKIYQITKGEVEGVTKTAQIREYLGVESIDKSATRDLLGAEGGLSPDAHSVLQLRADVGRTSVAKLKAMLAFATKAGRMCGMLLYHAAGTGRWGGKGPQPHNFPRGEFENVERFIPLILAGDYEALEREAPPVAIISSLLRSMLCAGAGKDLLASDLKGIESRVLNWLAGQEDVLANFRAYDAGDFSKDPYIINAMHLFELPFEEITKDPHRQTGKFQELGCGFGMGHKKGVLAANTPQYGNLVISEERMKEIVDDYRATHDRVVDYWTEANEAVIRAVEHPGERVALGPGGRVTVLHAGSYLYIILPSGRPIAYATPRVSMLPTPWGELKKGVEFQGVNSLTKQWNVQRLYGGLIVENIVQGVARDVLAEAMLRLESIDCPVVLDVHDEIVCEVREDNELTVASFNYVVTQAPDWAAGLPLAAEGWRGKRYRK